MEPEKMNNTDEGHVKKHETRYEQHDAGQHDARQGAKPNYWKAAAIALGALLLISLFFNLRSQDAAANAGVPIDVATNKALTLINSAVDGNATLVNKSETSGVYQIGIDINGEKGNVYVTNDGKLLFPQAIPLDATNNPTANTSANQPTQELPVSDAQLVAGAAVYGEPNATVTIVEFSDFQCPFCGKYFRETYPDIKKEYIDTGKVKYAFRHFPLGFHENAQKASEAAECAREQGKFWEMHDIMFENQNNLAIKDLKGYAARLGLATEQFSQCLDSGKYEEYVKNDFTAGQQLGVQGTPAFFVNGKALSGAQPFQAFKQAIDAELAASEAR